MYLRAMILAFDQAYWTPPHCSASNKQIIAGTNMKLPTGSSILRTAIGGTFPSLFAGLSLSKNTFFF